MTEISIQPAGSADIPIVQALFLEYGEYLAHNPTGAANICIENFDRELATLPAPYFAILLHCRRRTRGLRRAQASQSSGWRGCEMKRLWVTASHRGLGLGRTLVLAALDQARATGHTAIYLDTVPAAMPEANRLYAGLGFEEVTRYNTNPVADVVFFRRCV